MSASASLRLRLLVLAAASIVVALVVAGVFILSSFSAAIETIVLSPQFRQIRGKDKIEAE